MATALLQLNILDNLLRWVRQGELPPTEILVLLGAGVVVAGIALYATVKWLQRPRGVRLKQELEKCPEVAILLHPNPDPDAMACGMGVALLAERARADVTLYYPGQIRHQENRVFRTVLDVEMESVESADDIVADDVVLVDHNTPRGFDGAKYVEPYIVVDHHPGNGTGEVFTDQRTSYGSCAAIVAEYLEEVAAQPIDPELSESEAELEIEFPIPTAVATGLLYGIQSDTKSLSKGCSTADFEAAAFLYPGVDEELLDRIANPQVSAEVLEVKAGAIANRVVEGAAAVSDVGEVNNVDAIPQGADDLLDLEGVSAVVVYGSRDGTIHVSGRSRDDRVHMGNALDEVAVDIPGAGAGGHARMGGGQFPVEGVAKAEGVPPEELERKRFTERVFAALSGDV